MRSEYDSTFVNVQDDFKSMRFDWGRYMAEVTEHFVKQKKSIEDEKKRFKNVMKKKDLHIEDLQSRLNSASEQVKVTVQALEAQQRRVTIAQRDVYAAHEEVKDVNRKLNDQLYLASHQKCRLAKPMKKCEKCFPMK
uniref:Uncharacterized protein n=1 Tax=Ditylenchus dipsaci TaxID=166011 RepID=A0A915DHC1_9BILA